MTRVGEEPIHARGARKKKGAFLLGEGESELGLHGGAEGAWRGSK